MMLGYWTPKVDKRKASALLGFISDENTRWAVESMRKGESLPRSVAQAALLYCPDSASRSVLLVDGPALLEVGTGSCGSIAALEVGLLRAQAVLERAVPLPVARGCFVASLLRRPGTETIDYWHAVVRTPKGLVDPTSGLRQVCAPPEYA